MLQYVVNHQWLLSLVGVPALLAGLPGFLKRLEVSALHRAIQHGDATDQAAIRATFAVWVRWAEQKYGAGQGPVKKAAVDALLARALPFLPADQRGALIDGVAAALDAGAREATQDPPAPGA